MVRVGIPRCLGHFYLYPMYRTFLSEIGVPWEESPPNTAADLGRLSLCPTDEPCIAVRAAFSHVESLERRGVKKVFVPSVVSLTPDSYCCPKMMALPWMLKGAFNISTDDLLSPSIDYRDDPRGWPDTWVQAARMAGVDDEERARRALDRAVLAWKAHERIQTEKSYSAPDGRTAVMGHAYILEDVFASKVVEATREYGDVLFAENVGRDVAFSELRSIPDGPSLWSIERHILGSALHLLRTGKARRMIFVSAFSCGPASIIENYVADEAQRYGVPLLQLAVDEHSGEAGILTRVEAFMDSTQRVSSLVPDPKRVMVPRPTLPKEPGPLGLVDMGNVRYALLALFKGAGRQVVMPPSLTEEIVDLGREIAPEFICYPMVTLIGQMRYHAQKGIKDIAMIQGKGKCRLGWYAQVMEGILKKSGYDVRVVSIDSPFPLKEKWGPFLQSSRELLGPCSVLGALGALRLCLTKSAALDRAEEILREIRAHERERGAGDRLHGRFVLRVDSLGTPAAVKRALLRHEQDMAGIPRVGGEPLHILLIGEIYALNEPFVNRDVERFLGSLELRVHVHRHLDVTSWLRHRLFRYPRALSQYRKVVGAASRYLPVDVGGHGQESVGEYVLAEEEQMDGVIHLFPFTCMPEIIAQNILVRAEEDIGIPVLSLMLSEQTARGGLETRFEAFCDMCYERRRRRDETG